MNITLYMLYNCYIMLYMLYNRYITYITVICPSLYDAEAEHDNEIIRRQLAEGVEQRAIADLHQY